MSENFKSLLNKLIPLEFIGLIFVLILYPTHSSDLVNIGVTGAFAAAILLQTIVSNKIYFSKINSIFIIFLVSVIVSSFYSKVPELSLSEIVYFSALFFIFISFQSIFRQINFTHYFLSSFFIVFFLLILYYFINYLRFDFSFTNERQFSNPLYWYNQMAAFLSFLIPISLLQVSFAKGRKRIFYIFSSIILSSALLFTYSRASWFSLFLAFSGYLVINKNLIKVSKKYIISIVFFLSFSIYFVPSLSTRVLSIFNGKLNSSVSSNLRKSVLKSSYIMIKNNTLIGVGPGVFGQAFVSYQSDPWFYANDTHNYYVQMFAESGIFSGLIFIVLIFSILVSVVRSKKYNKETRFILFPFTIFVLFSFFHNLFDIDWNWPILALLFWMSSGALISQENLKDSQLNKINLRILSLTAIVIFCVSIYLLSAGRLIIEADKSYNSLDYVSALDINKKVIAKFPLTYKAPLTNARISNFNAEISNSENYYAIAENNNPYLGEPFYFQALIKRKDNQFNDAAQLIDQAIQLEPYARPEYYEEAARIALLDGNVDKSIDYLNDVVENKFPINQSFIELRFIYDSTGFTKELAKDYYYLADLLYKKNDFEKSKKILDIALINLDPNNKDLNSLKMKFKE